MGYSHGKKWSEILILNEIKAIIKNFNLSVFPSLKKIDQIRGCSDLSNAISRYGGVKYWSKKTKLPLGKCETNFGQQYEDFCLKKLSSIGYETIKMSTRYPYDLIANKHIKIDVKVGRLYANKNVSFYTFNLEKKFPTCDIFVCYCINKEENTEKVYIIPSKIMYGKTQLSIGVKNSIYDCYKDKWSIIKQYDDFYKRKDI